MVVSAMAMLNLLMFTALAIMTPMFVWEVSQTGLPQWNASNVATMAYIGVVVFVGLTAYDTQKLKNIGEQLSADDSDNFRKYAIVGALTLYLDFINLFLMLLRIFGNRR